MSKWSGESKQEISRIYDETIYQNLFNEIQIKVKRREAIGG